MADADRTVENLAIDIAGLLFEVRVAMAAVHFGIETLERRSETPTLAVELATLSTLDCLLSIWLPLPLAQSCL
jgi:hypothetical protein